MSKNSPSSASENSSADTGFKACPFCAEIIKTDAIKCKHCSEMLNAKAASFNAQKKSHFNRNFLICAAVFGGLVFIGSVSNGSSIQSSHRYAWQSKCDDNCAATLGSETMQKYNGENCALLEGDKMLYAAFKPADVGNYNERIAAITDRMAYENCN